MRRLAFLAFWLGLTLPFAPFAVQRCVTMACRRPTTLRK